VQQIDKGRFGCRITSCLLGAPLRQEFDLALVKRRQPDLPSG
jgi:hypothetical protein